MDAKTYAVHTSLREGANVDILKKRLQGQYPDHQFLQEDHRITIIIPMSWWDETDRDFFDGQHDKKMINSWKVEEA